MELTRHALLLFLISILFLIPLAIGAQEVPDDTNPDPRSTVQERFAPKAGRAYLHAAGTYFIRDDFYLTGGYGLDLGYHFDEVWGAEFRIFNLHSALSPAADDLRQSHSLVPTTRAPDALFQFGSRYSFGYGKILSLSRFLIHFDPQFSLHGGIILAEERIAPTFSGGLSFLSHFQHGVQVKLDLHLSLQIERRNQGLTPAVGFLPVLAIGWSPEWPR